MESLELINIGRVFFTDDFCLFYHICLLDTNEAIKIQEVDICYYNAKIKSPTFRISKFDIWFSVFVSLSERTLCKA